MISTHFPLTRLRNTTVNDSTGLTLPTQFSHTLQTLSIPTIVLSGSTAPDPVWVQYYVAADEFSHVTTNVKFLLRREARNQHHSSIADEWIGFKNPRDRITNESL